MEDATQVLISFSDRSYRWFGNKDAVNSKGKQPKTLIALSEDEFSKVLNTVGFAFRDLDGGRVRTLSLDLSDRTHVINLDNVTEIAILKGSIGEQDSPDVPGPNPPGSINDDPRI